MTNVHKLKIEENSYNSIIDDLIIELRNKIINNEYIDLSIIKTIVEPDEDNSKLVKFLKENKLMTQPEFNKIMTNKKFEQKVTKVLGGVPNTPKEFIKLFNMKKGIKYNINGGIEVTKLTYTDDNDVTHELTSDDYLIPEIKQAAESQNIIKDSITALLVIDDMVNELGLNKTVFSPIAMEKSFTVQMMMKNNHDLLLLKTNIGMGKDAHAEESSKKQWEDLISNSFIFENGELDFTISIFKKFIWQVKRKMLDNPKYPVTNHLMPVLTGPQGFGKSTFIDFLLGPINGVTEPTDFNAIQDNRQIDLWKNYVLNLSEMSNALKADMDTIKNLITSDIISRRPMRTNKSIKIKNNVTFIGSSNNDLNQIIKDKTGMRRFIDVEFSGNANQDIINNTDYVNLWRSVNPQDIDPMTEYFNILKVKQEGLRVIERVEDFLVNFDPNAEYNEHERTFKDYSFGKDKNRISKDNLYKVFKSFEKEFYPSTYKTSSQSFMAEFNRLKKDPRIKIPFEKIRTNKGVTFEYIELTND